MPSKKKSGVSRKGAVKLPSASVPSCFAASSTRMSCDKELDEAIAASKALAFQKDTYDVALAQALQTSRTTAEAEAEEAEQLRLAVEESLAVEERKSLSLGLKRKDQLIMDATRATSDLCSRHIPSASWETDDEKKLSKAARLPSMPALQLFEANTSACREDEAPFYVLKVTCRQDTRRLRAQWSPSTPLSEVLSTIWAAIKEGFDLQCGSLPAYTLRYPDDEGDLCTLAEGTVRDFLSMASKGKSFKLVLEEPSSTYPRKIDTEVASVGAGEPLGEFCIATPPTTPRNGTDFSNEAIEDDYDSAWSLVELAPESSTSA